MLLVENPKDATKTLTAKNAFSISAVYKVNIQKSIAYLYVNSETSDKEIKKTIPFTIASITRKYLRINLTKEVKYLSTENYKPLMKEVEENTDKWKDILCSLILFKCPSFPKLSIESMQSLSKFQWHFSQK